MSATPNTVFYGRVSTDRQNTYDSQLAAVREYCAGMPELVLDESDLTFYESDISGEYFSHDAYRRMLTYCTKNTNIRYICVYNFSRFCRVEYEEAAAETKRLQRDFGLAVLSASANEQLANERIGERELDRWGRPVRDEARMGKAITKVVIQEGNFQARVNIGKDSWPQIISNLERGGPPGGRLPAFFVAQDTDRRTPKNKVQRRVIPDPATREHHQAMFDFIASGGTLPALSRWLAGRGIVSSRSEHHRDGTVKGCKGAPHPPATLRYLLRNYMFIGEYCFCRYSPKQRGVQGFAQGRRYRDEKFWQIFPNYCEPTVDRETFFKVQRILETGERPVLKHKALLTGVLYCGVCGAKMTVVHSHGSYGAYRCSGKKDKTTGCTASEVTLKSLDGLVEKLMLEHYFAPEYMAPFCEATGIDAKTALAHETEIAAHEERMAEIASELAEIGALTLSLSLRSTMVRTLEAEREAVQRALADVMNSPVQAIDYPGLSASLREWWDEASFNERRAFVRSSFEKLVFTRENRYSKGKLTAYSRLPVLASPSKPIVLSA